MFKAFALAIRCEQPLLRRRFAPTNVEEETVTAQRDPGREFDVRIAAYLRGLRQQWARRRRFLKLSAGSAGAAPLMAALGGPSESARRRCLPGLYVLAQDDKTVTYALEGDVR